MARFTVLLLIVTLAACGGPNPVTSDASYEVELEANRQAKDQAFRTEKDSPIPEAQRGTLLPLSYFPIDPEYRTPAVLVPAASSVAAEMPTSTGTIRLMRRAGVLEFSIKNQPSKLAAFIDADDRAMLRLFVPFTDTTSGTETYVAGRYLDLNRTATGLYDLDFNRAYNPYCYFDSGYECPYPPAENRLSIPIRAGERLPKDPAKAASH